MRHENGRIEWRLCSVHTQFIQNKRIIAGHADIRENTNNSSNIRTTKRPTLD